jgi:hypothetical protein
MESRSAATASGVALCPRTRWAASPGINSTNKNIKIDMATKVIAMPPKRLTKTLKNVIPHP